MASEIQISRGSLSAKDPRTLLEGELFWVPANDSNNADSNFRKDPKRPFSRGDLYIGRPSLNGDRTKYESPMLIAGEKAGKALNFRGYITSEVDISAELFKFARTGDFYVFSNNAAKKETIQLGDFASPEYDFLKGDILLVTNADYEIAPSLGSGNIGESSNIEFIKINCSSRYAKNIDFDNSSNEMNSTNVQDAIEELNHNKISYRGRIPADFSLTSLMTANADGVYVGNKDVLTQGSMYLLTEDNIKIKGSFRGNSQVWTTKRGDFIIWQDDEQEWLLVPSATTDSEQIDFDPAQAVIGQIEMGTFNEDEGEHINSTKALKNVKDALTYLLSHKAMLDSNGKVPLSQLHSTVIGNLQYKGSWTPEKSAEGIDNPEYQNDWPTGDINEEENPAPEGDEEATPSNTGNRAGDYYIVSSSLVNVQYYDKTSAPIEGGKYARCVELNTGDYIIFNIESDGTPHWSVIDNSDRVTQLNFKINGIIAGSEATYKADEETKSLVGVPTFAASNKIVLADNADVMTFAGVRLIDQYKDDDRANEDTFVPVYHGNTDTIKRSTIKNYTDGQGVIFTETNSNVKIGDDNKTFNQYVYGDIFVRPKVTVSEAIKHRENTGIKFEVVNLDDNTSTDYTQSTLRPDAKQKEGTEIYLPDENAKVIGKLKGVDLISKRLTKSTHDGYIDSSSIEEHMKVTDKTVYSDNGEQKYSDFDIISIEFHAPKVTVNNIETRHITLGQKNILNPNAPNGGVFEGGTFSPTEVLSEIFAHPNQKINVTNYLPESNGVLINNVDLSNSIKGTTDTLPIYGEDEQRPNESLPRKTLIDSKIKQVSNALYDLLFNSSSNISDSSSTIDNISGTEYLNDTDASFNTKIHGQVIHTDGVDESGNPTVTVTTSGTQNNIILSTDVVVGDIEKTDSGIKFKDNRSLLVTKSAIIGNENTNLTQLIPGRNLFPADSQYRNARDESPKPIKDIYVEPPSESGVLLTSNSRIDGGFYEEN